MKTKYCYSCKKYHKINNYYSDVSRDDGISNLCKSCSKYRARKRRIIGLKKSKKGYCTFCFLRVVKKGYSKKTGNKIVKCDRCRIRDNLRMYKRKRDTKSQLLKLMGGKCVDCGFESKYNSPFDFHHADSSTKEKQIAAISHYNINNIHSELKKCVLICSNCHRIRHEKEHISNIEKQTRDFNEKYKQ